MQKTKNEIIPHYESHWGTQNQMRMENCPQCATQCATQWVAQNHMNRANGLIGSPTFEKKFEREFFGGGIPSFLENSYLECEENVRTFPSSFRLVPHNVSEFRPHCGWQ